MNKQYYIILILIPLSCFFEKVNAQVDFRTKYGIASIPVLKIGDSVPDFIIPKLFNSIKREAKMSDFKDQLLVLDFWATWCSGCVAGLPHMEELQKQFGDKVKMLPVTYQTEKEVIPFWKSIPYTKDLTIPTVIGDKQLLSYFPHKMITHDVWIYKGKVIAETGADYLTAENIKKVLSGAVINWPVKNDFNFFNGNLQPLFKLDSNQINTKNTIVKYAAISDYKPNITPPFLNSGIYTNGIVRDTIKKTIRVFEINMPIYNLYNINWLMANMGKISQLVKPSGNGANEVVWEVADKYKYIKDPKFTQAEWMVKNGICYESLNPDTGQTDQQVYQNSIQDLNRLLGLNVRWEKRKEKVLVLIHTSQEDKLKSKKVIGVVVLPDGRQPGYLKEKREIHKGNLYQFRDIPLPIVGYMNNEETNPYVFDETGYTNKVDMDLNIPSWTDIAAVRKAIKFYGLDLKEEERLVDKFVLTEVNGGLLVDVQAQNEAKAKRTAQAAMKAPTPEEGKSFLIANKKKTGVITLPSGVQYKVIKKGLGIKPAISDKIITNQIGMLTNGLIFYNTKENGRPTDPIGLDGEWDNSKGLQEALKLMPVGAKWEVYLPAELAFGGRSFNGRIPANSAVIYDVEVLGIAK